MSSKKQTSKELLGDLIDSELYLEKNYGVAANEDILMVEQDITRIQKDIRKKVDGIDHFMVELSRREHLIDAEIEAMKLEEQRLKVRRKAVERTKEFFTKNLLPMIVGELGDENGVYETDTARYKMFESFGPVAITDESLIPDNYKIMEYVEKINKKKARQDLTRGEDIPGFFIEKLKRVRRS
jgi:hypothetical protein